MSRLDEMLKHAKARLTKALYRRERAKVEVIKARQVVRWLEAEVQAAKEKS